MCSGVAPEVTKCALDLSRRRVMHDSLTQGDRPGIREDQIPNNGDDRLLDGCHPLAGRNHFGFIGGGVTRWINAGHGLRGHVCRENNLPWCTISASPSLLRGSFPRYYMTLSVASYLDLSHSQAVVSMTGDHMIFQYTVNACRIRPRTDISVSR